MYEADLSSWVRHRMDMKRCRRLLRDGSKSFFAASLLLPLRFRDPITSLYAFCRVADDLIDEGDDTPRALAELSERLDAVYARKPMNHAVDRAFADVVHSCGIPRALPDALLEGFAWAVSSRRYDTLSDVYAYSARVAGTVGTMMGIIMGVRHPDVLSRACDLGVAMQLTNIARDVGEDAAHGRLYLPTELLVAEGIDPDRWMNAPTCDEGIQRVVATLLEKADRLYRRSEWGIGQLPAGCRPAIFAARTIYAEIGREIERNGGDSVNQRAVVSTARKVPLLAQATKSVIAGTAREDAPPLREVRFLIDSVAQN